MNATTDISQNNPSAGPGGKDRRPLNQCVRDALECYFNDLDGHCPNELYELVLTEVEPPLLEVVLQHTRGNLSKAAQILGLNRATLRKKLKKYHIRSNDD